MTNSNDPNQTVHYETMPIQIYWKFYYQKNEQLKNSDIFHMSAQNIEWGYSSEPPRRGGLTSTQAEIRKIMYTLNKNGV